MIKNKNKRRTRLYGVRWRMRLPNPVHLSTRSKVLYAVPVTLAYNTRVACRVGFVSFFFFYIVSSVLNGNPQSLVVRQSRRQRHRSYIINIIFSFYIIDHNLFLFFVYSESKFLTMRLLYIYETCVLRAIYCNRKFIM